MKTKIKTYVGTALVACSLSFNSCTDLSEKIYDTMSPDIYQFTPEDALGLCLFLYIIVYVMFFGAGIVIPIFRDFRAIFGVFRIE